MKLIFFSQWAACCTTGYQNKNNFKDKKQSTAQQGGKNCQTDRERRKDKTIHILTGTAEPGVNNQWR